MDFNKLKTEELIDIYTKIDDFLKFLKKESQGAKEQ